MLVGQLSLVLVVEEKVLVVVLQVLEHIQEVCRPQGVEVSVNNSSTSED
jgi:hypothetical protein